jgi:hypothetical protein
LSASVIEAGASTTFNFLIVYSPQFSQA